jgi:hypothetical protein
MRFVMYLPSVHRLHLSHHSTSICQKESMLHWCHTSSPAIFLTSAHFIFTIV